MPGLVSIAIRAYRRQWLLDAIASVLAQTHQHLELVVFDDAGTLEDVATRSGDVRVRYHRPSSRLPAGGRFREAVALCSGDYIGVLDDDDRYEPEFVARLLRALLGEERAGVAFCRATWEQDGRRYVPVDHRPAGPLERAAEQMLRDGWTVSPSHMLMRRAAVDAALRDQPLPDSVAPDTFVNLRIAQAGWQHVLVDAHLVTCRWHDGQVSRAGTSASDRAVATWEQLRLDDPQLAALCRRRLARARLVRAMERLCAGDIARCRDDLLAAAETCPSAWPGIRGSLAAASRCGAAGTLAARAWMTCSHAGRLRGRPPRAIGDRVLRMK